MNCVRPVGIPQVSECKSLVTRDRNGEVAVDQVYAASLRWTKVPSINSLYIVVRIRDYFKQLSFDGEMSVYLQEALLIYIVSTKRNGELSVSTQDVISALQELKAVALNDTIENLISQYQLVAPELLLLDGFERYNARQRNHRRHIQFKESIPHSVCGREINATINPDVLLSEKLKRYNGSLSVFHTDLRFYLHSTLSLKDSAALAQTSKSNLAIYKDPRFWQDRLKEGCTRSESPEQRFRNDWVARKDEYLVVDKEGFRELGRRIGLENCHAITLRKIRNRELTIAHFEQPVEERAEEHLPIDRKGRAYLKNVLGLDCGPKTLTKIMRKEMSVKEAKELREDFDRQVGGLAYCSISKKADLVDYSALRKYVLDGSLEYKLVGCQFSKLITYTTYQQYIDSGQLSIETVCKLPERSGYNDWYPLEYTSVQTCIDVLGLPVELAVHFTTKQCASLNTSTFVSLFEYDLLTFEKYATLDDKQLDLLYEFHIHILAPDDDTVTLDDVINPDNYQRLFELAQSLKL